MKYFRSVVTLFAICGAARQAGTVGYSDGTFTTGWSDTLAGFGVLALKSGATYTPSSPGAELSLFNRERGLIENRLLSSLMH